MKKKYDDEDPKKESPWKGRIQRAKGYLKKHSTTWERNGRLLFGGSGTNEKGQEVSYGWGLVKSLETSIYVQNPETFVEPYDREGQREKALLWTSLCNYDFDMMDLKSIGNIGLIDNFVAGYFCAIEDVENTIDHIKDPDESKDDKLIVRVKNQEYVARRVAPPDLLVDHTCIRIDMADARWMATRFYPTVQELKEDKERFPNLPDEETLESYPAANAGDSYGREAAKRPGAKVGKQDEKDPRFKTIAVLELLDKVSKKVIYITEHRFKEIGDGKLDWPARFRIGARDMFPATIMAFHPMPNTFYARPELDMIANQLDMLNRLDSVIYEDAITKWRKWVAFAKFFNNDQLAKLTDMTAGNEILEVDVDGLTDIPGVANANDYPNLGELVIPLPDPSVKKDMLAVRDMVKQEITDIIGYGPPDRGGMPKTRSAREAVAIKEKLEARLAKRSDSVSDFYRLFGSKHLMFVQQTLEVDRYARVFPSLKPIADFVKYNKEQIEGEFNFVVFAGTSAPRNTEAKRASETQLFQTLMPLVQAGMIPPEPVILRLAEAYQWKDVDMLLKNYKPTVKELALLLFAMKQGKLPNGQPVKPEMLPNQAAKVVQAVLTGEEIQTIMSAMQGDKGGGGDAPQENRGDADATGTAAGTM